MTNWNFCKWKYCIFLLNTILIKLDKQPSNAIFYEAIKLLYKKILDTYKGYNVMSFFRSLGPNEAHESNTCRNLVSQPK